ncbi:MAG: hypothetical protein OQK93_06170, partial [Gammaproteobacteria bacterium]|nr:hypothetical protein [Gammaproteobacteria bacterium]
QAGEKVADGDLEQDCQWWTELQKQNEEQQKITLFSGTGKARSGKPKRRRSSAKKKAKQPEE